MEYNWNMKAEKKGKMTLDKLAVMVATGFSDMDEKLDDRFKGMETRMTGVESKTERMEYRLMKVEDGLLDLKLQANNLASRDEINEVKIRLTRVEKKVGIPNKI